MINRDFLSDGNDMPNHKGIQVDHVLMTEEDVWNHSYASQGAFHSSVSEPEHQQESSLEQELPVVHTEESVTQVVAHEGGEQQHAAEGEEHENAAAPTHTHKGEHEHEHSKKKTRR